MYFSCKGQYTHVKVSRIVRKPVFCTCENKDADQLPQIAVTTKLISVFVFATQIVRSLFFLNPKFQDSNHLMWLHSPVCIGPGRKPRRPVFSERGSSVTKGTWLNLIKDCVINYTLLILPPLWSNICWCIMFSNIISSYLNLSTMFPGKRPSYRHHNFGP